MVRKYSRSKRRVSRKRTTRNVRRSRKVRTSRKVSRTRKVKRSRRQRGGFTTNELVGAAAAVGLGLSALGYNMYNNKKKSDEAYENMLYRSDSYDTYNPF